VKYLALFVILRMCKEDIFRLEQYSEVRIFILHQIGEKILNELRKEIKSLRIPQSTLASEAKCSQQYISQILNGKRYSNQVMKRIIFYKNAVKQTEIELANEAVGSF